MIAKSNVNFKYFVQKKQRKNNRNGKSSLTAMNGTAFINCPNGYKLRVSKNSFTKKPQAYAYGFLSVFVFYSLSEK